MLKLTASVLLVLLTIAYAVAGSEKAGEFDYYVLALSWTPSFCETGGRAREASECAPGRHYGFTLHGLWPQNEHGWPSFCATSQPEPARALSASMLDIMGSRSLASHEWDKHGRCSGMSPKAYFSLARRAFEKVKRPAVFRQLLKPVTVSPQAIKAAFMKENPSLDASMLTVTCKRAHFQEVRVCLSKDLTPRSCAPDVLKDCVQHVIFPPMLP